MTPSEQRRQPDTSLALDCFRLLPFYNSLTPLKLSSRYRGRGTNSPSTISSFRPARYSRCGLTVPSLPSIDRVICRTGRSTFLTIVSSLPITEWHESAHHVPAAVPIAVMWRHHRSQTRPRGRRYARTHILDYFETEMDEEEPEQAFFGSKNLSKM